MRKILGTSIVLIAALLSGCGDNTLYGNPPPPSTTTPAQTMTLLTDRTTIPSDGSESAHITATVRGPQGEFLANVPINFSTSSGAISSASATTNSNGAAIVQLTADSDPTNRTITVVATNGPVTQTITVDVTGTQLIFAGGPNSLVQGGSAGQYLFDLVDSGGRGIPAQAVTLTSTVAANITPGATVNTDPSGRATFNVAATGSGAATLSATALGLTATAAVMVSNDVFTITTPTEGQNINLNTATPVTANWSIGGAAQNGFTINFATTRGSLSANTATTAGGLATVSVTSTSAGQARIVATTPTGVTAVRNVVFISTTPTNIVLQASPANVAVGTPSTLTAIVRDASANLVQGQTVNFSIIADNTGGILSTPTAVTDSQGRAQTTYTAGSTTSASNGVIIQATIPGTALTSQAALTVGGRNVFLSLGTGNTVNVPNQTQYYVEYSAQAIDSAGVALVDIPISFTVHDVLYHKGNLIYVASPTNRWVYDIYTTPTPITSCANEDINLNGVLDLTPVTEDTNGNGRLTPGDVATVTPRTVNTDSTGTATVRITYPKDHSFWATVKLTASAVVAGSQTSTSTDFLLRGAASDYSSSSIPPPGVDSPFGIVRDCANPN